MLGVPHRRGAAESPIRPPRLRKLQYQKGLCVSVTIVFEPGASVRRSLASALGVGLAVVGGATAATPKPAQPAQTTDADGDEDAPPTGVSEVVVTGVRPLLGDKLPKTLRNTPQSVTLVTKALMEEQGATRLEDALRNVPGVTLNAGEGAARGDTVNLRGFSAFNDFFLDGVRDAAVYNRDSFNLEAVEVVKGPSATLFGRGSTGGAINQVSKSPSLASLGRHDRRGRDQRRLPRDAWTSTSRSGRTPRSG